MQLPFTVLQNNSQQRTRLSDVTAPAFQHVARCPHYAEEALDAVRPLQVVDGRVHAAEAAIQQTLDGRYDSPASAVPFGEELPQPHVRPRRTRVVPRFRRRDV